MRSIRELDDLTFLDRLSEEYEARYGVAPFHLSHWDPSQETVNALLHKLDLPRPSMIAPYIFSYDLDLQSAIVSKLGSDDRSRSCFIVPNGTSAIFFAMWWLKANGVTDLLVICPCYFSVLHSCRVLGMRYSLIYAERNHQQWKLSHEAILQGLRDRQRYTALWITNPLYNTGVYWSLSETHFLNELLDGGLRLVMDECNVPLGCEVTRHLLPSANLLSLHSPHKSLCLNGVKFAVLIFDYQHGSFFTQWSDVVVGGLGLSSYAAVLHFLSDNFDIVQRFFLDRIASARRRVAQTVAEAGSKCNLDASTSGYLITAYAPHLPDRGLGADFVRKLIFESGATMIPGYRNHFDPRVGFSFRLNLARDSAQFHAASRRVIEFLEAAK